MADFDYILHYVAGYKTEILSFLKALFSKMFKVKNNFV